MSDYWLLPSKQFSAISQREQVAFQWDDAEVHFVLYRQTCFALYSFNIACLTEKSKYQFDSLSCDPNPRSTSLDVSMQTITPSMFIFL